jgi:ribosomal protein S18 acetylase RimI-like enzyme
MPSDARLHDAERTDLPALADLMAGSPLLRRYGITRERALASLTDAHRQADLLLIARATAGDLAGLAWVIGSRVLTGAAYLRLLLVAPAHRAQGHGRALLRAAEDRARAASNAMVLLVTVDNLAARRFYERAGYRHVGDLPDLVAPGLDEALYHKALRLHGDRLVG